MKKFECGNNKDNHYYYNYNSYIIIIIYHYWYLKKFECDNNYYNNDHYNYYNYNSYYNYIIIDLLFQVRENTSSETDQLFQKKLAEFYVANMPELELLWCPAVS